MQQYCLKLKAKNKKLRTFFNKLITIDKTVKEKVLSNYMELSRCRHCIVFAKWRLKQIDVEAAPKEDNKMYFEESRSGNEEMDNEVDYLVTLHKFRAQKAQKIRRSLFKDVEPGLLDLDCIGNNITYNTYSL